jgi:hypothetical protein
MLSLPRQSERCAARDFVASEMIAIGRVVRAFRKTDAEFSGSCATCYARALASVTIARMMARSVKSAPPRRALIASAAALAILAMDAGVAWPQASPSPPPSSLGLQEQGQTPPTQADGTPDPAPAPAENPGLIREMGKLFDKILPPLKSPSETISDLNTRAKDAGDALSRLAKPSSMVAGRTTCPIAVNGTPDCKLAADRLCQGKGYKEGKSLNTDSAETCSPKVLIPGRKRKPDDCRTDNYVTSALCQ